ncbi:MAG: hypothetical protein AB7H93_10170 [Vicinamibacterales bacterium]
MRGLRALTAAAFVAAAGLTAACGGGSQPAAPPAETKITPTDSGEMSPEEAGGMSAESSTMVHPPPHGGTTVKMGTVAQLEFVLDPSSGLLTAYVLDGMGMNTQRTTAKTIELQVTPPGGSATALSLASTANGLTGDTVGNSSQFGGTLPALKGQTTFTGVVKSFTVNGQTISDVAFSYPK